jgi:uncharacterized protein YkwD
MGRIRGRGLVVAGALVVAVVASSVSLLAFQGRDGGPEVGAPKRAAQHLVRTTTTSTTSTTTTTTTTTTTLAPPPPPPTEAPAPAPPPVEVLSAPPASAPVCDGSGSAVIDAMNGDRAANGVAALCGNGQLAGYAQNWANWMAQNQSLTHSDLQQLLAATTFTTVGENILTGPGGMPVDQMESAWMQSPSHRENILNGAYRASGVGIAYSADGRVWVAVEFGN